MGIDRTPTDISTIGSATYVYTGYSPDGYAYSGAIDVSAVHVRTGPDAGYAEMAVKIENDQTYEQALAIYGAPVYVLIFAGLWDGADAEMVPIFEGVVFRPRWSVADALQTTESMALTADHISVLLDRLPEAQIRGAWFVSETPDEDGAVTTETTVADGLPAVFNADRLPDRAESHTAFASGSDTRTTWTLAAMLDGVIRYHLAAIDAFDFTEILDTLDGLKDITSVGDVPSGAPAWAANLARVEYDVCVEGCSGLEAIAMICDLAGLEMCWVDPSAGLTAHRRLRLLVKGSGTERWLKLGKAQAYDASRRPEAGLRDNNLNQGTVQFDHAQQVTQVTAVGEPNRYFLPWTLTPLWAGSVSGFSGEAGPATLPLPDDWTAEAITAHLDLSGEDRLNDPWYTKYATDGASFKSSADNRAIGRLWGLNEAGAVADTEAMDVRETINAAFEDDDTWAESETYIARHRRFAPAERLYMPTGTPEELIEMGMILEASFDGGSTWAALEGGYEVLADRCAIWISARDLAEIAPKPLTDAPETNNLALAAVDGDLRLRLWAAVAGDSRLASTWSLGNVPAINARGLTAIHPGYANTRAITPYGTLARDDSAALSSVAARTLELRGAPGIAANPVIPWTETLYDLGDVIAGIAGRNVSFKRTCGEGEYMPQVVGIIWRWADGSESTELVLEDYRYASEDV